MTLVVSILRTETQYLVVEVVVVSVLRSHTWWCKKMEGGLGPGTLFCSAGPCHLSSPHQSFCPIRIRFCEARVAGWLGGGESTP